MLDYDDDPETLRLDDVIPMEVREQIVAMVNETTNRWLESTRGLPVTLQLTRLGFAMITMLEKAYRSWVGKEKE